LLDIPLAETLEGRILEAALDPSVTTRPIGTLADYEAIGERTPADPGAELPAEETLAKLRALGYVGSAAADPSHGSGPASGREGHQAVALNRYNRAIVLAEKGRWSEALRGFQELQADETDSLLAHLARHDPAAAVVPLESAVEMAPELPPPHALLGEAYLSVGRVTDAQRALESSLEIEPNQGRASLLLAGIVLGQGETARAAILLETALRLSERPRDLADACVGLAIVAEESGRFDEAAQHYRAALERVADYPRALERYANLELYRGRPERAADLLARLTRAVPNSPGAFNLYARALVSAGRAEEARDALARSLELAPDQPAVRESLREIERRAP
jgi:tetratricopeptide (TPR) repeat protein